MLGLFQFPLVAVSNAPSIRVSVVIINGVDE